MPGLGAFRVAIRPPGGRAAPSGENLVPCFNFHVRFQGQRQEAKQQAHAAEGACVRAPSGPPSDEPPNQYNASLV